MRERPILLGALFTALAAAPPAVAFAADTVEASRYELVERSHVVDVRVDRGHAKLVVQRIVENLGPKSDQATFMLAIPESAVATRLRTAGADAKGRRVWFEGELMEAEAAAAKYRELTGIGGYYPKDPALLSWRNDGLLALQVFPVPARGQKVVEYTLEMPLEYSEGAYRVELPELGTEDLPASVRFAAVHAEDVLTVNGVTAPNGVRAMKADRTLSVELHPRAVPRIDGAVASVGISPDQHLVRMRVATAPRISDAPRGAHVAVVFDNSRSVAAPEAQLAAVRAYLGHMGEATVDFLAFDREVTTPLGRSLPVKEALARLATYAPVARNGSRLDDALARADAMLAASPAAARRVVVVTDTRMRSAVDPARLVDATARSRALVHVAVVNEGEPNLARDDDSPWALLPRRTGGLFWWASASSKVDGPMRSVFEQWARPTQIDKVKVSGIAPLEAPESLREGDGVELFEIHDAAVKRVELSGELWSRRTEAAFEPTSAQGKRAAALLFGTPLYQELDDAEQLKLAMLGGVVSPMTSYLAIEPGVRPSTEGLDWTGVTGAGGGLGSGQGFGAGHARMGGPGIDRAAWLRERLATLATGCGAGSGATVSASLEVTLAEIVEVLAIEVSPAPNPALASCVRDALWDLALPPGFDEPFQAHRIVAAL